MQCTDAAIAASVLQQHDALRVAKPLLSLQSQLLPPISHTLHVACREGLCVTVFATAASESVSFSLVRVTAGISAQHQRLMTLRSHAQPLGRTETHGSAA